MNGRLKMKWKQTSYLFLGIICLFYFPFAHADKIYLEKFTTYMYWVDNIPTTVNPDFLAFVAKPSPLTRTLRAKWLTQLARRQDWATYDHYYRQFKQTYPIQSVDLQCYAEYASYQQGHHEEAIKNAQTLWLDGHSRPKACDKLFTLMVGQRAFSDTLIEKRIVLALDAKQFTLARSLLKQLHPARLEDINRLNDIIQNPKRITALQPGPLHGAFYLTGLKLLITHHMDLAIQLSETPKAKSLMNQAEQQNFIGQIALYKTMRGESDAILWLNRVKPAYVTPTLNEWRIREAIAHQRWQRIIYFVQNSSLQKEPTWQYWLARAYEARGEKDKARALYQKLGQKRHYYGFLANIRLHQPLKFEFEPSANGGNKLAIYKPITDTIQKKYTSGQVWLASSLLNAFISELPKDEQSALTYWVKNELHWQGKAIILSNTADGLSNELELRFPLAYRNAVKQIATQYRIEEALIYAIIRQESLFFEDIVSTAGAKGLMQVMPRTAKLVTKQAHIRYNDAKELLSSEKNIRIGTAYIQQLGHQFKAHPALITAAYNAGPRQARYWQMHHAPEDMDRWIETLPWQETRNYLKNVIAFYAVYQYRLRKQPSLEAFLRPLT